MAKKAGANETGNYRCECPGDAEGNMHKGGVSKRLPPEEYKTLSDEQPYDDAELDVFIYRRDCPVLKKISYQILAETELCLLIRIVQEGRR